MDKIGLNSKLKINIKRVIDNIEKLSKIGFVKNQGICRLALSDTNKLSIALAFIKPRKVIGNEVENFYSTRKLKPI